MLIKHYTYIAPKKVMKIFIYLNLYTHGMTIWVNFNEYYFKLVFILLVVSKYLKK